MGELDLIPAGGGQQYDDRIEPYPGLLMAATTTAAWSANDVNLTRFRVARPFTASKLSIMMGATSAGNVDLGIYTSADMSTFTKVASTGSVSAPTLNTEGQIALTAAYSFAPGVDYWFGMGVTDATITLLRVGMLAALGLSAKTNLKKASAWSSGLPASLSSMSGGNAVPFFALIA